MYTKHLFLAVTVTTLISGLSLSPAMAEPSYASTAQASTVQANYAQASNLINSQVNLQTTTFQKQAIQTANTLSTDAQNFQQYTEKHAAEVEEAMEETGGYVGGEWVSAYSQADIDSVADDAAQQWGAVDEAAQQSTVSNEQLANQRTYETAQSAQNLQNLMNAPTQQGDPTLNPVGTSLYVRNYATSKAAPVRVTLSTTAKKVAPAPVALVAKAEALSSFTKALPIITSHS
jgi:hypothetical protein